MELPFDINTHIENERLFLGARMSTDPDRLFVVNSECFVSKQNRAVYDAMRATYAEHGQIDVHIVQRLAGISVAEFRPFTEAMIHDTLAMPSDGLEYVVLDQWVQRETYRVLHETSSLAYGKDRLADALARLESLREKAMKRTVSQDSHARFVESIQSARDIIRTHIPGLDAWIGGFEPGDLVIIGARPSVGKTAFAVTLGYNIGCIGHTRVDWHSYEMEGFKVRRRAIARMTGISSNAIRNRDLTGEQIEQCIEASNVLEGYPVKWFGSAGVALEELTREIARTDASVVIVDHLGCIPAPGRDTYERTSRISNELRSAAKANGKLVIVMAQLNRKSTDEDRVPDLTDLRNSGDLEQDADIVLMLHEPDREHNVAADRQIVPIVVYGRKVREGMLGKREMMFNKQLQWIYEVETRRVDYAPQQEAHF